MMFICIQSNPLAHLDLIDYACQDLVVSFAVGNKEAGLSNFSPNASVTVDIGGTHVTLSHTQRIGICKFVPIKTSYEIVMIQTL
jgi:hypothetical protein